MADQNRSKKGMNTPSWIGLLFGISSLIVGVGLTARAESIVSTINNEQSRNDRQEVRINSNENQIARLSERIEALNKVATRTDDNVQKLLEMWLKVK